MSTHAITAENVTFVTGAIIALIIVSTVYKAYKWVRRNRRFAKRVAFTYMSATGVSAAGLFNSFGIPEEITQTLLFAM